MKPYLVSYEDIDIIADQLLDMKPDPIPRYILLKEFKRLPESDTELQNAYYKVLEHPFIAEISKEQDESGYWKEFHGYTEGIIRRLLFMGLDGSHICLKRAAGFIEQVLEGNDIWHQRIEKHDTTKWWLDMFMPLASAAVLSLINPVHPLVKEHAAIWREFAKAAFRDNNYNASAESRAQYEYFNIKTKRPIPFCNYYVLLLLTSGSDIIPEALDNNILEYWMDKQDGIYYVYGKCPKMPVSLSNTKDCYHWLRAVSLLSRYKGWDKYKEDINTFLWSQRNIDGIWDFTERPYGSMFPLSDSWRKANSRVIDSSIYILRIMSGWRGI